MSVRVVSPHIAHAWVPTGFFVLHSAETEDQIIAAAVTCATGTSSRVWLASPTAFLRQLNLRKQKQLKPIQLDNCFLSSLFEEDHSSLSDTALSLDVGTLHSASGFAVSSSTQISDSSCSCCFEVFGEKGYACVGFHDGRVQQSFSWREAESSLALVISLGNGSLWDAIVPRGFSSSALLTVSCAGLIRAASGSSYGDVLKRASWVDGKNDILSICQKPVFYITDPGRNIVVILGCYRAGVVLFNDKNERLASSRFLLKGSRRRLNRYSLLISEEEDCKIVIEEVGSGHRTGFTYEKDECKMAVDLDFDNRFTVAENNNLEENHSMALRSLLQGIEELGERERCHQVDSKMTETLISSYNSAFMFLTEWKERNQTGAESLKDSCSVTVDKTISGCPNSLYMPDPLLGVQVSISVSFKNTTGTSLGSGWMLRLSVWRNAMGGGAEDSNVERRGPESKRNSGSVMRVMTCPVGHVSPNEQKVLSFPFVLDSHAPLALSVVLAFRHTSSTVTSDSPVDIEVKLLEDGVVDILNFSNVSKKSDIQDYSHEVLAGSQLMRLFDKQAAEKQRGYPQMSRFEIPLTPDDVRGILCLESSVNAFESPLGSDYTICVAPVALQNAGDEKQRLSSCSLTLRGVSHVLPFVRAAIIRRILVRASKNDTPFKSIVIKSRKNVEAWRRSLQEAADQSLPSLRRAETRIVEALRIFAELEAGSMEHCLEGNHALTSALQAAKGSYGMWRRQMEHRLWTPKGAVDSTTEQ